MNYELAKQLKDLGFPQEPKVDISGIDGPFFGGFYYICKRDLDEPSGVAVGEVAPNFLNERQLLSYSDSDNVLVKIPQLEELIGACHSDKQESAFVLYRRADTEKWTASSSLAKTNKDDCEGSTPTEAVARLWLALNTK